MTVRSKKTHSLSWIAAIIMLTAVPGFSLLPVAAQNPWHEDFRVTIDEQLKDQPEDNLWSEEPPSDKPFDESKYPPLDEDTTLGITMPVYPGVDQEPTAPKAIEEYTYPDTQVEGQLPAYSSYPYGRQPGGYRPYSGYHPGYYGSGWPGGSGWGGAPYGGNSWGGFPFGMGNTWMPFNSPGFW